MHLMKWISKIKDTFDGKYKLEFKVPEDAPVYTKQILFFLAGTLVVSALLLYQLRTPIIIILASPIILFTSYFAFMEWQSKTDFMEVTPQKFICKSTPKIGTGVFVKRINIDIGQIDEVQLVTIGSVPTQQSSLTDTAESAGKLSQKAISGNKEDIMAQMMMQNVSGFHLALSLRLKDSPRRILVGERFSSKDILQIAAVLMVGGKVKKHWDNLSSLFPDVAKKASQFWKKNEDENEDENLDQDT